MRPYEVYPMRRTAMYVKPCGIFQRIVEAVLSGVVAGSMAVFAVCIPIIGWVFAPGLAILMVGFPFLYVFDHRYSDRLAGECPHCSYPILDHHRLGRKDFKCPHCTSRVAIAGWEFLAVVGANR